jgi:ectoine hydroxylase-related dioxygenase (phytanoyl-CoA dioxygenase family)
MVGMISTVDSHETSWIAQTLEHLKVDGVVCLPNIFNDREIERLKRATYTAFGAIEEHVGKQKLVAAGEVGVVRCPMKFDDAFFIPFANGCISAIVERILGPGVICHLQNAFIFPSIGQQSEEYFQGKLHRDFSRYLNGYMASLNSFICLSDFTPKTGSTRFLVGSQQQAGNQPPNSIDKATSSEAPAGSVIFFDSTIWHAAGVNTSAADRLAINMQWTRSYIKQQFDYVRVLGDAKIKSLPDKTQQYLGWYTRVVTSLDDYYMPPEQRLYRAGQG